MTEDTSSDELPNRVITENRLLAEWLDRVACGDWIWARNSRCKYVELRIDTRSGAYRILDRDGKPISFDQLRWQYSATTPQPPNSEVNHDD